MKNTRWTYFCYFLRNAPQVLLYKIFHRKPRYDRLGKQKNISLDYSRDVLKKYLAKKTPFAIVRLGGTEISTLNNYQKIKLKFARKYKKKVKYAMRNNGGFFPTTDENLTFYSQLMFKNLAKADVLGISGLHMEDYFHNLYTPQALAVQNWVLDPLLGEWSSLLKGKTVLVISPLEQEIQSQYQQRLKLFKIKPETLPNFNLKTIPAVQTIGDEVDERFSNWFAALDYMKMQILKTDFDIALVGAGVYGTPLCIYIKELGKQAIQTGGATQLLFGIIGKRWENREYVSKYINEYWIRPRYLPAGYEKIEKGCYW